MYQAIHKIHGTGEVRKTRTNANGVSYYFWFNLNGEWEMDWIAEDELILVRAIGERPENSPLCGGHPERSRRSGKEIE